MLSGAIRCYLVLSGSIRCYNVIQKLSEDKGSESKSELKVANISDIIDSWSEILNKIDSPVLKQTVKQAKIEKGQNFDIILNFDSQFHYDKFNTTTRRDHGWDKNSLLLRLQRYDSPLT